MAVSLFVPYLADAGEKRAQKVPEAGHVSVVGFLSQNCEHWRSEIPFSNEDPRGSNLSQEPNSPRVFLSSVFFPFFSLSPYHSWGSELSMQWERWQQAAPAKQLSDLETPFGRRNCSFLGCSKNPREKI